MNDSKMDRQGVRTPADVERKYPLGDIGSTSESSSKLFLQLQQLSQRLEGIESKLSFLLGGKTKFTVTFKNGDAVCVTVPCEVGASIEAPTVPTNDSGKFIYWADNEGNRIIFPYTPTSDVELEAVFYAYDSSFVATLYEYFGVSQTEYPYISVRVCNNSESNSVCFSVAPLNKISDVSAKHMKSTTANDIKGVTSPNSLTQWVKNNFVDPTLSTGTSRMGDGLYFVNYFDEVTDDDTTKFYQL